MLSLSIDAFRHKLIGRSTKRHWLLGNRPSPDRTKARKCFGNNGTMPGSKVVGHTPLDCNRRAPEVEATQRRLHGVRVRSPINGSNPETQQSRPY